MTAQDLKYSILQLAVQGKLVPQNLIEIPVDLTKCKLSNVEELLFDIPDTWKIADIEAISKAIPSKQYQIKESEVRKEGTYIVISQSKDYSIGFSNDATKLYRHSKPVIVFGDHTTEVKHIDFDFVVGADGVKIFEPNEEIVISKYFYFVLLFYSLGIKNVGGYSRHYKYIKTKPFPIPPLTEQERIVAKIEELLPHIDEYDKAEKKLSTLNAEFPDKLRKSILQQAVMGKLTERDPGDEPASELLKRIRAEKEKLIKEGKIKKEKSLPPISEDEIPFEIPETWEWVRLSEICNISDGTHQTPNYVEHGMPFLSAQNIKPYSFIPEIHRDVSYEDFKEYNKNVSPEKGDILMTRVGAGIGEAAIINQEFEFSIYVSLTLIKSYCKDFCMEYLLHVLNSPIGRKLAEKKTLGKGASQGNLNLIFIREFVLPIPPLSEQKRIVARVEELLKICDELK